MILQSSLEGRGKLTLHAAGEGLVAADLTVDVTAAAVRPAVPALPNPPLVVLNWKRSPVAKARPDPNEQTLASDMNSWTDAHPGSWLPPFRGGLFAIYRARVTPRASTQATGGTLRLRGVAGRAQVWIDGKQVGEKPTSAKADLLVPLAAGTGERTISVLVEAEEPGTPAGLGGVVTVE